MAKYLEKKFEDINLNDNDKKFDFEFLNTGH